MRGCKIHNESLFSISWPLTTHNGSLMSYPYTDPQHNNLLTNKPYLLLVTLEKMNIVSVSPSFDPSARLFYASLPGIIQNLATFDIRACPAAQQSGSNNICMS
jgi:hypothetical protein